jgi:hypothetical protein
LKAHNFNASIAARAICESCADSTPEMPMAPTILPSITSG